MQVDRLITCLPQPELHADRLKQQLKGTHHFTRRVGDRTSEVTLTISQVEVKPEGLGAVEHCVQHNVIGSGDGYVAFFDLGRNTAIYWLVDMMGDRPQPIWASRGVIEAGGLQRLLVMIQRDPDMRSRVGRGEPNLNLIHQGIVSGQFVYGSKFEFKDIFDRYATDWLRGIKDPAFKVWETSTSGWLDELSKVVFVGGAAPVSKVWVDDTDINDGWLAIAPDPQLANTLGLLDTSDGLTVAVDPGSGWIKVATSTGYRGRLESYSTPLYAAPANGEVNAESVYLHYHDGPAAPWRGVVGSSAHTLSVNPTATVNTDKGAIAERLVLAALDPVVLATSSKTTPMRRRRLGSIA